MENVLLVIHLLLALAIIGLVLIQRSEGGGLGMGSGGGLGNFATPRATANALTRATGWCAAAFFVTSLALGILAGTHHRSAGILDTYGSKPAAEAPQNIEGETPGAAAGAPSGAAKAEEPVKPVAGDSKSQDSKPQDNKRPDTPPLAPKAPAAPVGD